jgi:hypothetical protein
LYKRDTLQALAGPQSKPMVVPIKGNRAVEDLPAITPLPGLKLGFWDYGLIMDDPIY